VAKPAAVSSRTLREALLFTRASVDRKKFLLSIAANEVKSISILC